MNILIVLTSHDQLGDTGKKTGFLAGRVRPHPIIVLKDGGAVSHAGLRQRAATSARSESDLRRESDRIDEAASAQTALHRLNWHTKRLADVSADDFDAILLPRWTWPDVGHDR